MVLKDKLVPKQQNPPNDLNPLSKDVADSIKAKLKENGKIFLNMVPFKKDISVYKIMIVRFGLKILKSKN